MGVMSPPSTKQTCAGEVRVVELGNEGGAKVFGWGTFAEEGEGG